MWRCIRIASGWRSIGARSRRSPPGAAPSTASPPASALSATCCDARADRADFHQHRAQPRLRHGRAVPATDRARHHGRADLQLLPRSFRRLASRCRPDRPAAGGRHHAGDPEPGLGRLHLAHCHVGLACRRGFVQDDGVLEAHGGGLLRTWDRAADARAKEGLSLVNGTPCLVGMSCLVMARPRASPIGPTSSPP